MSSGFGKYLTDCRTSKGYTQQRVAEELKVTQELVWQHEHDRAKPRPEQMAKLAVLYNVPLLELLQKSFLSDHLPFLLDHHLTKVKIELRTSLLWEHLQAGVDLLSGGADLSGSKVANLRALVRFSKEHRMHDLTGQLDWERSLPSLESKLECFWVAHLDFINEEFYEVARANIAAGAKYVYFIRQKYMAKGAEFDQFRARLAKDLKTSLNAITRSVVGVPFGPKEVDIIKMDFVAANPHLLTSTRGFQPIWTGWSADRILLIELPHKILTDRIRGLENYVTGRKANRIPEEKLYPRKRQPADLGA